MKLLIRFLLLLSVVLAGGQSHAHIAHYEDECTLLQLPLLHAQISNGADQHPFLSYPNPLRSDESTYNVFTAENQSSEDDDDSSSSKDLKPAIEAVFSFHHPIFNYPAQNTKQQFLPSLLHGFISSPRYIVFRSIRI